MRIVGCRQVTMQHRQHQERRCQVQGSYSQIFDFVHIFLVISIISTLSLGLVVDAFTPSPQPPMSLSLSLPLSLSSSLLPRSKTQQHGHFHHPQPHLKLQVLVQQRKPTPTLTPTCLFGQNRKANANANNSKNKTKGLPVIPVIGPIPAAPPLMIGSELTLDPPTPLQWKALQECVVVHRNQLKLSKEMNGNSDGDGTYDANDNNDNTATIDAAPLIAIIDDASGISKINPPFSPFDEGGRYATLAAVVGITTNNVDKEQSSEEEDFLEYMDSCPVDDDDNIGTNDYNTDTNSAGNLHLNRNDNDLIVPLSSSIRLVGVGRAVLRKYFYRIPTELCVDGEVIMGYDEGGNTYNDDDDYNYDGDDNDDQDDIEVDINFTNGGYEDNTPIVMAQFEPLVDDSSVYAQADPDKIGEKGQRSYRSSPVHAMSELFSLSNKVAWAHDDRRKLISGIKAARARLDINQARRRGEIEYDDGLEDFDGLGALFENYENDNGNGEEKNEVQQEGMSVDEFLATFKGNMKRVDPSELPQNQPTKLEILEASENYGMGYFGAFSSIAELTAVAMKLLEPYYSEEYRQREEHEAEVSSFVIFRALEGYIDNKDIADALHCTSSVERLMRGYELMIDHKIQLKKIAEKISDELRDCGEECTDLW